MPDYGMEDIPEGSSKESTRPITEENTPENQGETIHIPREFLQGTTFKSGDELILKVVSSDEEGLEVAYAKAPEKSEGAESKNANEEIDSMDSSEY